MSATPQQNKLHVFLKAMEERKKKKNPNNPETNKQAEKNESKCSLILARSPMVRVQALFLKNTPGIFVRKKTKMPLPSLRKKTKQKKKE